jgi:hypothetical protein
MDREEKLQISEQNKEFTADLQYAFASTSREMQRELMNMPQEEREQWLHGKLKHSMRPC